MANHPLEIILGRQFADSLSMAVFITDTAGNLLYYNESAEKILGKRFEETGFMPVEEWATTFNPMDETGAPLPPEDLPLVKTLSTQRPAHGSFWIESLTGVKYLLSVTSIPIIGRGKSYLGAMAIFWKEDEI